MVKPINSDANFFTLSESEKNQLVKGLLKEKGCKIDESVEYDELQSKWLYSGCMMNFDVSLYADPKFNALQMSEIYFGLLDGLDAKKYADPHIPNSAMYEIRMGLEKGVDITTQLPEDTNMNDTRALRQIRTQMELAAKEPDIELA